MKNNLLILTYIVFSLSLSVNVYAANGKHTINVKGGTFDLATENQTIAGSELVFDTGTNAFAVEYEYAFSKISIGGEVMVYSNDYKTKTGFGSGEMDTTIATFNVKKYFNVSKQFKPFIGTGIGLGFVELTGFPVSGDAVDFALQFMLGMEYRFSRVGVYAEYKYLVSEPEYEINGSSVTGDLDASGQGFFAGIAIHF